tara:strand:+ start:362 stop:931 length:570 start_codon:yes stop_codon:yes gene_type:complete
VVPSQGQICGVILCGGRGSRVDGCDKPLLAWRDAPMVDHIQRALSPQVAQILISANRSLERYAEYGTTIADHLTGYQGPLAGVHAALHSCTLPYLFVCPGDSPMLSGDIVQRLARGIGDRVACIAHDGERAQNLHALLETARASALLETYLAQGKRSAYGFWSRNAALVDCSDITASFRDFDQFADFSK